MQPSAAMVMTTIFDPVALEDYFRNFERFGHLEHVRVILIPDRKTPQSAYERCAALSKRGLHISCPNFEEQESFLKRVGLRPEMIPYNSDNRRNVGYLMALEASADFIISVDDDNYCRVDEDFYSEHAVVCRPRAPAKCVETDTGWFNICSLLTLDRPGPAYARGFPYFARHKAENPRSRDAEVEIHVNAGLWLADPDMDGLSWMVNPVQATALSNGSVNLSARAWTPVNSQNTALRREVMPSYYFARMGHTLSGLPIDRYGDIFSGYFAQACVYHLGGTVRAGTPVAEHKRNSHNYVKDAMNEWACIVALEDVLAWLPQARLSGNSYGEAYTSLSHELESVAERSKGMIWTDTTRAYFHELGGWMREWVEACKRLGA